jgi:hypothetical protein
VPLVGRREEGAIPLLDFSSVLCVLCVLCVDPFEAG